MKNISKLIKLNLFKIHQNLKEDETSFRNLIYDSNPWFNELNSTGFYLNL